MTYRRVVPLDVTITSENEYSGHEIFIHGVQVGYRSYDGSDSSDVVSEVAVAAGALLLEQLRKRNRKMPYGSDEGGSWYEERPKEEC